MKTTFTVSRSLLLFMLVALFASGCLIPEKKEYHFKVNQDGTGSGTVRYVNLVSQDDEEQDVSFKDFAELVTDYIQGNKFEEENPHFTVTDKKLYEENGVLVGEFTVTFGSWEDVGFFHAADCDCCPTFYYFEGMNNETFESSNGEYLGESGKLPLVLFPAGSTEFNINTVQLSDLSGTHPLIDHYRNWKK